jgi:hypothetical protein
MTLEWEIVSPSAARTKCRRYTVGSSVVDDRELWETWKMAPGGPWFAILAKDLADENAARAAAERDAETALV